MPGLLTRLLEAGVWRREHIPNDTEIKFLLHLASSKEARLIVRGDQRWGTDAGVTNTEFGEPGFINVREDPLTDMLVDWHNTKTRPWVDPDPEYDKKHKFPKSVHAYKINEKGYEAIAQHALWTNRDDKIFETLVELLKKYRDVAQALKPKSA